MRFRFAFAAIVAAALPRVAAAQEAQPQASAPAAVQSYPAAFFASSQPNTAMDMVLRVPGFSFERGDDVRGFSGAAGNVLIDGERPTTKSDDLESVIRRVPASQVERIDVIRGGAPGIDMQGQTILANIIRKKEDSVTGLVAVANTFLPDGRNNPALRLEATRRGDGRTWEGSFLAAGFMDDGAGDGPRVRWDTDGDILGRWNVYTEGDGQQIIGTTSYEMPLAGGKFKVNGRLFNEMFLYDEVAYGVGGTPDGLIERDHQDRLDGEVGLRYGRDLGPRTKIETLAIQQVKTTDLTVRLHEDGEIVDFLADRVTGETIGRATLAFRQSGSFSMESGAEGAWNWLESETALLVDDEAVDLPAANVRVEELRGEAFTQGTWTPNPHWTVEAGLRYEASQITSEGDIVLEKTLYFAKPRVVTTWSPAPAHQFRVRIEREVGQLNFDDFVAAVEAQGAISTGNPDLDPENAWVVEGAYEHRFWNSGSLTLTARHFDISDVIDRAPDPSGEFDAPANIGEGTRDEVGLTLTLPLDKLGLKGGQLRGESTWRRSKVTDPTTGEEREISGEHPVDWEAHFTDDMPRWKLTYGVDVYGAWRETYYRFGVIETLKLKTFVTPWVEWKPRPDIAVRADISNVTARDLTRTLEVYEGPRDSEPLDYYEHQALDNKPTLYVRVRKTFG